MGEFRMPVLGADMEAGTLVEWVKHPGEAVKRGDIIAVVDTQKGAIEVEVFEDGVIDRALVKVGEQVPVGTVLAVIRGEAAPVPPVPVTPVPPVASHAADGQAAMRAAIAAAMSRSKREIPHYYLSEPVDMTRALAWLRAENEKRPVPDRLLPVALLVKAAALSLRDVPELNGYWVDGAFKAGAGIHVGCAVSLRGGGLVAPAIHDADRLDLTALMRSLRDLTARARAGTLRSSELADATITVTNLGDRGVESAFGIIYPPQVALVGFGRTSERPWSAGGRIESRTALTATLSADHRASDGHRGGLFLAGVAARLQQPEGL